MKRIILIGLILVFLVGCSNIKCFSCDQVNEYKIVDFHTCVAKGNPVMESYPRQCRANGQTFVEVIEEPVLGGCGTVTPGLNDECCANTNKNTPHPACVGEWKWIADKNQCVFSCITEKLPPASEYKDLKYESDDKMNQVLCESDADCEMAFVNSMYHELDLPSCDVTLACKEGKCVYSC